MDSAKNGRWIIPFKKFGMVRVNMLIFLKWNNKPFIFDTVHFHFRGIKVGQTTVKSLVRLHRSPG